MFGESRSESPRLPSPWQQAVASAQVILTPVPDTPKISEERHFEDGENFNSLAAPLRRERSNSSIAVGVRAYRAGRKDTPAVPLTTSNTTTAQDSDPSYSNGLSSYISRSHSTGTETGSFTSDPDMHARLWSSGLSENLIMRPGPDSDGGLNRARSGGSGSGFLIPPKLVAERDKAGHIEYKFKLTAPTQERFDRLTTQLKWRLTEGGGEAMYEIGVLDDGTLVGITRPEMEHSLRTLELMAAELGATVMVLRTISLTAPSVPRANKVARPEPRLAAQQPAFASDFKSRAHSFGANQERDHGETPPQGSTSSRASYKLAKFQEYLNRSPDAVEKERQDRAAFAAKKKARHLARMDALKGAGIDVDGQERFKGRNRSGPGDEWVETDEVQEEDKGFAGTVRSSTLLASTGADKLEVNASDDQREDVETVQAASWQRRNLERAHMEWDRLGDDHTIGQGRLVVELESARSRRRRKPWREKSEAPRPNATSAPGKDVESDSPDPSTSMSDEEQDEDQDEDVFQFDGLDTPPSARGNGQPLTVEALAGLDGPDDFAGDLVNSFIQSGRDEIQRPQNHPNEHIRTSRRSAKRKVHNPPKTDRSEKRRMDLLRGDGVTAEGDHLFAEDEDSRDSIFLLKSGASPEGELDNGVQGVLDRLMGLAIPGPAQEVMGPSVPTKDNCLVLSSSPSATVKQFSPGNDCILANSDPPEVKDCPSPTQTIVMPLDTMSLSFSLAQTAVGAGDSSESEGDGGVPPIATGRDVVPSDSAAMRLCVEAIVIKKMDADERYSFLDFEG